MSFSKTKGNRSLSGHTKSETGSPLDILIVRAFDCDIKGSESLLGESTTDGKGKYEIAFDSERVRGGLRVRVYSADKNIEIAVSAIDYKANEHTVFDIIIAAHLLKTGTEWVRYGEAISPLLDSEKLKLRDLTDAQLDFVAGKTKVEVAHLRLARLATQWGEDNSLPPEAVYGTLRVCLPLDWRLYLQAGAERWRKGLEQAINDQLIKSMDDKSISVLIEALTKLAVDQSFKPSEKEGGSASIGLLLQDSKIARAKQEKIATIVVQRKPDDDHKTLWDDLKKAGLTDKDIGRTRFAVETYQIVDAHLPTLQVLQGSIGKDFGAAIDLAQLSLDDWKVVTKDLGQALPPGKTSEEYATSLANTVELLFPSAVVAHALSQSGDVVKKAVGNWLTENPNFDLLKSPAPTDVSAELSSELRRHIGAARISPAVNRAAVIDALLKSGLDSAMSVQRSGAVFVRQQLQDFDPVVADQVIANARQRAIEQTMLAMCMKELLSASGPVLPRVPAVPGSELASWADMFGVDNTCACSACCSVHGPAAYLVDLLHFLSDRQAHKNTPKTSLLDILDRRRPDIRHLKLSCDNTDTSLPYIDLVCELLEREVNNVLRSADDPRTIAELNWPQTRRTSNSNTKNAARLRALPDERNSLTSIYEATGPLQDEDAVYPWNLPFDRSHEISKLHFGLTGTTAAEVLALFANPGDALHRARLGMSASTWTLLHNTQVDVEDDGSALPVARAWGFKPLSDDRHENVLAARQFLADLEHLAHKREDKNDEPKSGLLGRSKLDVSELFELVKSSICWPKSGALRIFHRPGADPCDVTNAKLGIDRNTGDSTGPDLVENERVEVFDMMHRVLRLRLALNWSLTDLLIVLQALRVEEEPRLINLENLSRLINLASRLGVSQVRLARHMIAVSANEPQVSIFGLSLLNLSATDHTHLLALGLPNSLANPNPSGMLQSLEEALEWTELLRAAGHDPAELRYLLRHEDLTPAVFEPRAGVLDGQVQSIMDAIAAASPDVHANDSELETARILETSRVNDAVQRLSVITGSALTSTVVHGEGDFPLLLRASEPRGLGGAIEDFIALWKHQHAYQQAIEAGLDASEALQKLEDHRRIASQTLARILKVCRLLDVLKFTAVDVKALASMHRVDPRWPNFDHVPVTTGDEALNLSDVKRLVQTAVVQAAMPVADKRLLELFAGPPPALADVERTTSWGQSIPGASDGAAALGELDRLLGLGGPESWLDPMSYVRLQAAVGLLRRRGLGVDDVRILLRSQVEGSLAGHETFGRKRFTSDDEFYAAVAPAMDQLRVSKRDALLGYLLQSDKKQGWLRADDIYDHLLIDVQMGPCQLTSRIVQAHAAIQLLVQRCLLNLEQPSVQLGDTTNIDAWRQWEWMKHYRVWEAGRKVFLYPENWIEPELRDLKSPFFEDLETDLLQDEITPETVERAVRTYLTKLHEVADLDVRALYEEKYREADGSEAEIERTILHMAARTYSEPHIYFYRQRSPDLTWSPWEKIDFTIDADHLVLAVHNRRPTLFWPSWREVQVGRSDPPHIEWEMQLNWSSREFGSWTAPIRPMQSQTFTDDEKSSMTLRPRTHEGSKIDLEIHLFKRQRPDEHPQNRDLPVGFTSAELALSIDGCTQELARRELDSVSSLWLPLGVFPKEQFLEKSSKSGRMPTYLRGITDTELALADMFSVDIQGIGTSSARSRIFRAEASQFRILPCHQYRQNNFGQPYVFKHTGRTFYAFRKTEPMWISAELANGPRDRFFPPRYILESGNHPFVCDMLGAVRSEGLNGLYRPTAAPRRHPRQLPRSDGEWVKGLLDPDPNLVDERYPVDEFDFSVSGAYSLYNWEVFFHVPLLLAERLSEAQRFEEAQKWFHTIFDPTDISTNPEPQKFWQVKPLLQEAGRWSGPADTLQAMMRRLTQGAADFEQQVEAWRNDPFNPHLIARLRLVAYMKVVVQKYVENLIAWADSLFRRDTMESINEATQLYVLASRILGEAPVILPPVERDDLSFDELTSGRQLDPFSNILDAALPVRSSPGPVFGRHAPAFLSLYFCVPGNPRLPELRATVTDRLLKIRSCMDIEGNTRQLALFAPPIDPALLVRARAAGLEIGAALQMALTPTRRHYRFHALLQKALEFCGEVRSFGGALLSALEKRDGELLAQMRSRHEVGMLRLVANTKRQQLEEAVKNLQAVRSSRSVVDARLSYFLTNLEEGRLAGEQEQLSKLNQANNAELFAAAINASVSVLHAFPTFVIQSPAPATFWGGPNLGHAAQAVSAGFTMAARHLSFDASMSGYESSYERREAEWRYQVNNATQELLQIDQQIAAAEIRVEIARGEQANHEQQIAQAEEAESMLREKFTSTQLYGWMSAHLSALHYQAYRMAYDLANQAQEAAKYELDGISSVIGIDNWESGRRGLLAGERLAQDLRRLELAYMQRNGRKLEITSNISLRRLDPVALLNLRHIGECAFTVPQWLFDLDFPGQGNRRIKSVSISVPGVVGPYGGVNGILTLVDGVRLQSIATSSGQNDSGVFQLDFRDERYLPFEGVSLSADTRWRFQLNKELRSFDYDTISDVILHVSYTAEPVIESSTTIPQPSPILAGEYLHLISVRHDFPEAWRQLSSDNLTTVELTLEDRHFPYFDRRLTLAVRQVEIRDHAGAIQFTPQSTGRRLTISRDYADSYILIKYGIEIPP